MQEYERIAREPIERDVDDVVRACKTRMGVADRAFGLKAALAEPKVHDGEARAAMVILAVVDARCTAVSAGDEGRA